MGNEKIWFVAFFAFAIFVLGGLYFSGVIPGLNSSNTESSISVSGSASVQVAPDQAMLYLKIDTLDDEAALSQSKNAEIYDSVKAALLLNGIKESDIKTTYYNIDLRKEWKWINDSYDYEILGYGTTHELTVTARDIEQVGKILDAVVSSGATVDYVYFQLSDEARETIESSLISEAVLDSKKKADSIAQAAGMTVSKLLSASYGTPSYYYPYSSMYKESGAYDSVETSLSPGEMEISVYVSASYELK